MSSLLKKAFLNAKKENRPALLTYTVAGDNTKKKSLEILKSISNYADICELGFPRKLGGKRRKKPKGESVAKSR
jgi:tryptophan synthase alpha chain